MLGAQPAGLLPARWSDVDSDGLSRGQPRSRDGSQKKFVMAGRLFIGPWYTQIDEMTTAGESAVHNLRLGLRAANKLGGAMPVGYLPDSFGQSQDIPKLYGGFGIHNAVFWRGLPLEKNHKFFFTGAVRTVLMSSPQT